MEKKNKEINKKVDYMIILNLKMENKDVNGWIIIFGRSCFSL